MGASLEAFGVETFALRADRQGDVSRKAKIVCGVDPLPFGGRERVTDLIPAVDESRWGQVWRGGSVG